MVGSRESDRIDPGAGRSRAKGIGYALLVALVVGVLTTTLGWALAPADERTPPPVADPSLPAVPLPTLARATPSTSVRPSRPNRPRVSPTPSARATPSPAGTPSPNPSPARPSASPSATMPELTPLPARQERDLRSVDGGPETVVEFVNHRDEQVTVYRLNEWGHRVRVERLTEGESHQQTTYVGHPWVVTNRFGSALAVFQPVAEPARAIVR